MTIKFNSHEVEVETIKWCSLSSGYSIGLFRNLSPSKYIHRHLVCVKKVGFEGVFEKANCLSFKEAITYYLDYICCYA